MKLQPDRIQTLAITGYGEGWIAVNGEKHTHSIVLSSLGLKREWHCSDPLEMTDATFAQLSELGVEMIIYGSGKKLCFPRPEWLAALYAKGIGVESMDTQAACRTYNILAAEGRKVAAALLVEPLHQG
jgi:uncharacterized protein